MKHNPSICVIFNDCEEEDCCIPLNKFGVPRIGDKITFLCGKFHANETHFATGGRVTEIVWSPHKTEGFEVCIYVDVEWNEKSP